jgi:DNA-binding response OmpR family regulator
MAGRILVIEDEEHIRTFIEQALTEEGYDAVTAEHGAAALALLEKWVPDLILLDIWMPILDGRQFVQAYRRQPRPLAPVIIMSAVVSEGDRPLEIEADGFIAKPLDLDELLDLIGQYTGPSRTPGGVVH